ncbi:MAG: hypothetical protein J7M34_09680 [Anaerolineae bacterium]|nr:hypothetical protein [Anaerolineae bacterium]
MYTSIPPAWALGMLLASIYATIFYIWRGMSLRDLPRFLIAGWLGFALGQWCGHVTHFSILQIGQLNIVEASLGAWATLFIARRL